MIIAAIVFLIHSPKSLFTKSLLPEVIALNAEIIQDTINIIGTAIVIIVMASFTNATIFITELELHTSNILIIYFTFYNYKIKKINTK